MFSNNLSSIDGVSIFPVISLVLFFGFFVILIYKVIRTKQSYIREVEKIPLTDNDNFNNNSEIKNEN